MGCAKKAFHNIDEKKTEKKKSITNGFGHFTNMLGNNIQMWSGIHKTTK